MLHLAPCQSSCQLSFESMYSTPYPWNGQIRAWQNLIHVYLQHGIFFTRLSGTLSTAFLGGIRRGIGHHLHLRPQSLPQPLPNCTRLNLLIGLLGDCSHRLFPHPPINQPAHRHPLCLHLPCRFRLLLRCYLDPHVDDG